MAENSHWITNAALIEHFEDGMNNNAIQINVYLRNCKVWSVELAQHNRNEGRRLVIPCNVYNLIDTSPGVQTAVPDQGTTHGRHVPQGMAQVDYSPMRTPPGPFLAEGYTHRDLQDFVPETHPPPAPQGQAPKKARAGKESKKPRPISGQPTQTKNPRGRRTGPMTDEGKAHAALVKKSPLKDCICRRKKTKCGCVDLPVARENATQSRQPSYYTGPAKNTRSTHSRNPSSASHQAVSTPTQEDLYTGMYRDLGTSSTQNSYEQASIDNSDADAPGDTDDEVMRY